MCSNTALYKIDHDLSCNYGNVYIFQCGISKDVFWWVSEEDLISSNLHVPESPTLLSPSAGNYKLWSKKIERGKERRRGEGEERKKRQRAGRETDRQTDKISKWAEERKRKKSQKGRRKKEGREEGGRKGERRKGRREGKKGRKQKHIWTY